MAPHAGQRRLRALLAKPDAKVITGAFGRRVGKTTGLVEALLERTLAEPAPVGWAAPVARILRAAWEHAKRVIPPSAIARLSESEKTIRLKTGATWQFVSMDDPDNALGWGYRWLVIDEAARVSQYARDEILGPMVADYDGTIIQVTTPKGKRGKAAHVWRDYLLGKQHQPGYYSETGPTTENPLPGIRSFCRWAEANMPRAVYEQEILAKFLEYGAGILDITPVCVNGGDEQKPVSLPFAEEPGGETFVKGVDLAKSADWTVLAAIGRESLRLKYLDRFNRLPWGVVIERMRALEERYPGVWYVDATGLGEPVVEMMQTAGLMVEPVVFTNDSKTALVQGLQLAIEKKGFTMPYISEAVDEAEAFEGEVISGGRMRYAASAGFTDDIIVALGLANHGLTDAVSGGII